MVRELVIVLGAVSLGELSIWALGVRDYAPLTIDRWPWLAERSFFIFPVLLTLSLVAIRRWPTMRSQLGLACLGGLAAGLAAGLATLLLAQIATEEERLALSNGLRMAGVVDFLLIELTLVVFSLLGWLSGVIAAAMAFGFDLVLARVHDEK